MIASLLAFSTLSQLSASDIYKTVTPSIVSLYCEGSKGNDSIGTGFFIDDSGTICTALHVIQGAKKITAKLVNGNQLQILGVIDKDSSNDLAIIRAKDFKSTPLKLESNLPEIGSQCFVIGSPKGLEFSITDGIISQVREVDQKRFIQYSAASSPGNSGGPLVNGKGEVLGVVDWQISNGQNLNFAVPSRKVLGLDPTRKIEPLQEDLQVRAVERNLSPEIWEKFKRHYYLRENVYLINSRVTTVSPDNFTFEGHILRTPSEMQLNLDELLVLSTRADPELLPLFEKSILAIKKSISGFQQLLFVCLDAKSEGWTHNNSVQYGEHFDKVLTPLVDNLIVKQLKIENDEEFLSRFVESTAYQHFEEALGVRFLLSRLPKKVVCLTAKNSSLSAFGIEAMDQILTVNGESFSTLRALGEKLLNLKGQQVELQFVKPSGKVVKRKGTLK
jgi:hypothetical protein